MQRMQFPLTLAYAVTIHKVQGLSLRNIVISFELRKQKAFNFGQVYVALSRCTSLNGMHILGTLKNEHVKVDPRTTKEYERLRNISSLPIQENTQTNQEVAVCTIILLNIRSLNKHCIDIKYDSNLLTADLLALTETQLLPNTNDTEIRNNLYPFILHRQDHVNDRFCSLAMCINNKFETTEHLYFPQINGLKFKLTNKITKQTFTVILLYRKNNSNFSQYVDNLRYILNTNSVCMILGDFNMNYLNKNTIDPLNNLLTSLNYTQIVQKSTLITSGSIIDLIYLKSDIFNVLQNSIVSVYYSDHEAVKISVQLKIQSSMP